MRKRILLIVLFLAIVLSILAGLVYLARKKKKIFWAIVSISLLIILALFLRNKFMNYYKFIDEECGFEVSDNLVFLEGEVSLDKKSYILLFEVKDGCENNLETLLEQNIHIECDKNTRRRKITNKKYSYVYNEGEIKQIYSFNFAGKEKSLICVYLNLIEKDGKLYFFVYTW